MTMLRTHKTGNRKEKIEDAQNQILRTELYSMGPNNFAVSGSIDGCWISTGPNSLAESVSVLEGLDAMGPNNFGDLG